MRKGCFNILLPGIFLVLLSGSVLALDCQYTDEKELDLNGINFFETSTISSYNLNQILEFSVENENLAINIKNNLNNAIKVRITATMSSRWFGDHEVDRTLDVGPLDRSTYIDDSAFSCRGLPCGFTNIKIYLLDPTEISYEVCRVCNEKDCLGDGSSCSGPQECGSGSCVENYCSNSKFCYNDDCKCSDSEIQCDNKRCVNKNIIPLDVRPECNMREECISGYIDPKSRLCAKSPAQLEDEENARIATEIARNQAEEEANRKAKIEELTIIQTGEYEANRSKMRRYLISEIVLIGSICIIIVLLIIYEKKKGERIKNDIERIQKEINLNNQKQSSIFEELEKGKRDLFLLSEKIKLHHDVVTEQDKKIRADIEINQKRLEKIQEQLSVAQDDLKKNKNDALIKDTIDRYVKDNVYLDKDGYFRFNSKSKEYLHIYLYRENYPLNNYQTVHHIDVHRVNNQLWNLIALPKEKHYALKHARIIYQDWNSGIQQLREQLGMKDSDFPEHIQKEIEKRRKSSK